MNAISPNTLGGFQPSAPEPSATTTNAAFTKMMMAGMQTANANQGTALPSCFGNLSPQASSSGSAGTVIIISAEEAEGLIEELGAEVAGLVEQLNASRSPGPATTASTPASNPASTPPSTLATSSGPTAMPGFRPGATPDTGTTGKNAGTQFEAMKGEINGKLDDIQGKGTWVFGTGGMKEVVEQLQAKLATQPALSGSAEGQDMQKTLTSILKNLNAGDAGKPQLTEDLAHLKTLQGTMNKANEAPGKVSEGFNTLQDHIAAGYGDSPSKALQDVAALSKMLGFTAPGGDSAANSARQAALSTVQDALNRGDLPAAKTSLQALRTALGAEFPGLKLNDGPSWNAGLKP